MKRLNKADISENRVDVNIVELSGEISEAEKVHDEMYGEHDDILS